MVCKIKFLLLTLFVIISANGVSAKDAIGQPVHREIKWKPSVSKKLDGNPAETVLSFEGVIYGDNDVPQYMERFPVASASGHVSAEITATRFEALKDGAQTKAKNKIGKDITVKAEIIVEKKIAYVLVSFIPVRKSSATTFEKLVSFDLTISTQPSTPAKRTSARYYSHSSVLATGSWYRVGVVNDGIQKLTYQNLKDLGINVDAISTQNIRVYGNGGGMLPFANSIPRYDDLQENAIYVADLNNNGKLDKTDYILFYGESPNRWNYSTTDNHYHHTVNLYSDTTYYFITTDLGTGKRIQPQASTSSPATETVTKFDDYAYHELDAVNWLSSGRMWFGEVFDEVNNTNNFPFNFPNSVDSFYVQCDAWARSVGTTDTCHFILTVNGNNLLWESEPVAPACYFCTYALPSTSPISKSFVGGDNLNFNLTFYPSPINPEGEGWLNYIEVNAHRQLTMAPSSNQLEFRNMSATGAGKIAEYDLGGSTFATQVWEISDPLNITNVTPESNSGGVFAFRLPADTLRQFIAFNGAAFYTPALDGLIPNQNLHGLPQTDMVIVTHPNFMSAALQLAQFHRDNDKLSVQVVSIQQVYNEYSSGKQDVTAIRDFMKMFYDRATGTNDLPKYLLLFGRGSYDPKNRVPDNTDYIVCYESANSNDPTSSYMSDDFFGFLDDNEGDWDNGSTNLMDISIGRLPAATSSEAQTMVNKIIHYSTPGTFTNGTACTNGASSSLGDWRNVIGFVCDEGNENIFVQQSEAQDTNLGNTYKNYNIDKIYTDAYKEVATPGGNRYPDAEAAIVDRVQRGALLINYIGHGGPVGWAADRILTDDDINGWTNYNSLPAFMTATCDFSTADDPAVTSAGELVLENPNGGGIALFTTCRLSYSESNFDLGNVFYTHFFNPIGNRMPRVGEICMLTKNQYLSVAVRNFLLLGDPALTLAYPKWSVTTTTINGAAVTGTSIPDTMKALQKVTIAGYVDDGTGKKLTNFNGVIYPTVFDKAVTSSTLGNDLDSYPETFQLQNSILYKGAASVTNGNFSFTFVVPKDISYQYGFGRLSYYADNQTVDASGHFTNVIIGGVNANAPPYTKGPTVKLYMNDTTFVFGGLTNQSPSLYAKIIDSSGVSTVGNGIGHDITAQLDNNSSQIYVLNNYYQADLNSYQSGKVIYPFSGLSVGAHTITFKVWDVYNNSSEAVLDFVVSSSTALTLAHVLNYPNPFTTSTKFFFEYNKPCMPVVVQIQIFSVSGKLVKTIRSDLECDGFRSDSISWDGLDDYGDKIGRGVYVYRLKVHASDGSEADKYEKLVILR